MLSTFRLTSAANLVAKKGLSRDYQTFDLSIDGLLIDSAGKEA
jgi:hypothetical protein